VSVPMEEKTEKSKGKRVTKNSTVSRGEDSDLEKAVRKPEKEQRKIARRKAKEDKELERALELSKQDAEREKSASLMLELPSASSSSSPPKLDVLGATSVSGAKVRVCALTGIPECDPFTEEKALNSDDSSNRLMLQSPPDVPPFESKNSKSPRNADHVGRDELDVSSEHEGAPNLGTSPTHSMNSLEEGETLHPPSEKEKAVVKRESTEDEAYCCDHLLASTSELESIHTEREMSSDASEVITRASLKTYLRQSTTLLTLGKERRMFFSL
jgi:hypothetical protein